MSVDIRLPNITGATEKEKVSQISRYLYQLTEQLNFALNTVETEISKVSSSLPDAETGGSSPVSDEEKALDNFNEIKSLIIKSADIVNAYYTEINERLTGEYVASSDFGEFTENTIHDIIKNNEYVSSSFSSVQTLKSNLDELYDENGEFSMEKVTNGRIKAGELYTGEDGFPVYGVEIGQKKVQDGVEIYNKFAQFTSDKLAFFNDGAEEPFGYISYGKLYIQKAEIRDTLILGKYQIDTVNGLAFKWIGG